MFTATRDASIRGTCSISVAGQTHDVDPAVLAPKLREGFVD
jgi:hypothetical protein